MSSLIIVCVCKNCNFVSEVNYLSRITRNGIYLTLKTVPSGPKERKKERKKSYLA